MKILFCFYPLFVHYNHGVALLSSLCKERGIETDLCMLDTAEAFIERLENYDGEYVSFSCVVEKDYELSRPFMTVAKFMGKKVLLGGVFPRRGGKVDVAVDYVCRGDGEALPDFLLHGDDRVFKEKQACQDLDRLPLPDYEMFKEIPFDRDFPFFKGKKVLPYYSSRGCPWQCNFCEVRGQEKRVIFRHQVGKDLKYLVDTYKPDAFMIGDETIPYYNKQWRDSWGDFSFPFMAYIRADIATEELEWLKERGMIGCAFGVESGDEEHRNSLNKNLSDSEIHHTVGNLNRLGIQYTPFFMVNTPGESFRAKAKTFRMAEEIGGFPVIFEYENLFQNKYGVA